MPTGIYSKLSYRTSPWLGNSSVTASPRSVWRFLEGVGVAPPLLHAAAASITVMKPRTADNTHNRTPDGLPSSLNQTANGMKGDLADSRLPNFIMDRDSGYFFGRDWAYVTPRSIHPERAPSSLIPSRPTNTIPFMGRPVKSMGLAWGRANESS